MNRNSTFDEGIDYNPAIDVTNASRSKYILEERRTDQNDINVTGQVTKTFGSILKGSLGYNFRWNRTEYYKIVKDLLGGDYWLNIDQFAERDFGSDPNAYQNDLDHPNRVVKEGDKYMITMLISGTTRYGHPGTSMWAVLRLSSEVRWDTTLFGERDLCARDSSPTTPWAIQKNWTS